MIARAWTPVRAGKRFAVVEGDATGLMTVEDARRVQLEFVKVTTSVVGARRWQTYMEDISNAKAKTKGRREAQLLASSSLDYACDGMRYALACIGIHPDDGVFEQAALLFSEDAEEMEKHFDTPHAIAGLCYVQDTSPVHVVDGDYGPELDARGRIAEMESRSRELHGISGGAWECPVPLEEAWCGPALALFSERPASAPVPTVRRGAVTVITEGSVHCAPKTKEARAVIFVTWRRTRLVVDGFFARVDLEPYGDEQYTEWTAAYKLDLPGLFANALVKAHRRGARPWTQWEEGSRFREVIQSFCEGTATATELRDSMDENA